MVFFFGFGFNRIKKKPHVSGAFRAARAKAGLFVGN
jgi:hypothetical protein